MQSQQLNCPKCGQVDLVQKVSAVVSSGIYTSTGTKTAMPSGQTDLSKRLMPPRKPSGFSPMSCAFFFVTAIVLYFVVANALMWYDNLHTVDYLTNELKHPYDQAESARLESTIRERQALMSREVTTLCAVCPVAVIPFAFAVFFLMRQAAKTRSTTARWESAIQRWNELYYCGRDDGVFNPAEGVFVPTANLQAYLYN